MTILGHGAWGTVALAIEVALFAYFVGANAVYAFTAAVALVRLPWFVKLHRVVPLRRTTSVLDDPVSVIVPAFNEERIVVKTVRSLLALEYPAFEVIVVNDGSTDGTLDALVRAFGLEPFPAATRVELETQTIRQVYWSPSHRTLRVVDKANGGKADALNAGLNVSQFPLALTCDADSYYHPSALQWMTEPFEADARTVVVGGAVAVGNDCIPSSEDVEFIPALPKGFLLRFQALEYLRAFLANRLGWAPFNALCIVSGACGLWRKDVLIQAGGFRTDTVWEDMEMTLRVHHLLRLERTPYRIGLAPYPVCWTTAPDTIETLFRQRVLWHRHLCECMTIHRRLLARGGVLGWLAMPYMMLFEWLAPIAIAFGLTFVAVAVYLHALDLYAQLLLLALVFTFAIQLSLVAVLLDELSFTAYDERDVWRLFATALLENFGYRQLVTVANFAGFVAWALRRPHRGTKPPGPFVEAYPPGPP